MINFRYNWGREFFFVVVVFTATLASGIYGRELTGVYKPTPTQPLIPSEAQKSFTLPEGYEMRLFASEPDVINPVAMTWDERGRLWVLELFEYPSGAPEGSKPRDKVKVLEDTDGDGKADKVTVFAEGLNLATGLALGNGGVYVGQAPHLLFFKDFDGDDVADTKEIVLTGFGLEDRHELLNGFQWGPDGWLYMTHGVFTHSKVKDPNDPADDGVIMNAALARFHPSTKKFEIFADGTSNPWGVDFDIHGNAFVSACVIDHLFHLAPGGLYVRQAGSPAFPFAYELLPSIVDHRHFRAAYAGVQVYQGGTYPESMNGKIFMGNIHHNSIHQDELVKNGSSFRAKEERDFVKSNDGWFRPVAVKTGPDGNLWIMDWYDKYPCYQNAMANPEGVDRQYGRIWRVVYTGGEKKVATSVFPAGVYLNLDSKYVVKYLEHKNNWIRRKARQILSEKKDASVTGQLVSLVEGHSRVAVRLEALWTLHGAKTLTDSLLDQLAFDKDTPPAIKTWVARLSGERNNLTRGVSERLSYLANDPDVSVRTAVATALRQFMSGSLTVNTPPRKEVDHKLLGPIFENLLISSKETSDHTLKFLSWMATEPLVSSQPSDSLDWFLKNGEKAWPLSGDLLKKSMRRLCDTRDAEALDIAVRFLDKFPNTESPLLEAAMQGLIQGQKSRSLLPSIPTEKIINRLTLSKNASVKSRANELGTLWGNVSALDSILRKINDGDSTDKDRIKAIEVARILKDEKARDALLSLVNPNTSEVILLQAVQALGELGGNEISSHLIKRWNEFTPQVRSAIAQMMTTRWAWSIDFVDAIQAKKVIASELPTTVIRTLFNHNNKWFRDRARKAIGSFNAIGEDRLKIFNEKREIVVNGAVDLEKGKLAAEKSCLVCHKLYGNGYDVGPDLTGVGRSSLDALLSNVIIPNQIIGNGYELVIVETKDFRTVSGRLIEDTPNQVTLVNAGGAKSTIERDNIESLTKTKQSVMPEGLELMPDEEFRNLIWYILSPHEEGELTNETRKALIGNSPAEPRVDHESVSLWNPDWRVVAPEFEGSPVKIPNHMGAKNVLMLHPFDEDKPAGIERTLRLPEKKQSYLSVEVASHKEGNFELQIIVNGQPQLKKIISRKNEDGWQEITFDLTDFSGQEVTIFCGNFANDWHYEFSYWKSVSITSEEI